MPVTCDTCLEHTGCTQRISALEDKMINNTETIDAIKESLTSINVTLIQVRTAVIVSLVLFACHQFGILAVVSHILGGH